MARSNLTTRPGPANAITVEAWVEVRGAGAEAIQPLASKWPPLETFDTFEGYDAGHTDDLDTTGFFGAVFDGRYVYFVPQHDTQGRHGKVLRYDTHSSFKSPTSWSGYDAGNTDGLNTKGYYGAVFDGRFVYFVPRRDNEGFHSRVLRYDTRGDFTDRKSWAAYDVGLTRSYQSAAFDGRYIYFCPGHATIPKSSVSAPPKCASPAVTGLDPSLYLIGNSVVLRHDTQGGFKKKESWATYDAAGTGGLDVADYDGACFDGRYVYFVPLSTGAVLRHDTRGRFDDPQSWDAFDTRALGLKLCVGAVFDGRHIYFVPYGDSEVAVRYDIRGAFHDRAGWSAYQIAETEGLTTCGFDGGMFDGRYIYFVPYYDGKSHFHGQVLRHDTRGDFTKSGSWEVADAGSTDGLKTIGFNAGTFDGRYLYFAPWQDGGAFPNRIVGNGRVLRYDTVGTKASFSLRVSDYGHNGGLCAALPGARFLVNTERGALSVSMNRKLESGRHHLVGVYDGKRIRLFVDGVLANEQSGSGRIHITGADVSSNCGDGGLGSFDGRIEGVRIFATARSARWIQAQYENPDASAPGTRRSPRRKKS